MNLTCTVPYLLTNLGEIPYETCTLKIHELDENWHREGHTLPVCIHEMAFGNNEYNNALVKFLYSFTEYTICK
jgi:hypothetical protein